MLKHFNGKKTTKRYNLTQVPAVRHKQSITDSANPTKHTLLLLISLLVYMFRFKLLLLFIIVHLIFNSFLPRDAMHPRY